MTGNSEGRIGGTAGQNWKQMSSPHGYDQPEFEPGQAPRDFKRVRHHEPDDERRRLRNADADMEGASAGSETPPVEKSEKWDDEDIRQVSFARRLYRD